MIVKRGKGDFHQTYRPCRLSEVVGNDEVKRVIEQAFKENNVPHSFLFHGLSGTGKTTIARIIEMGLNCAEGPTSEPCCECDYCRRIINRSGSLAVREINAGLFLKDQLKEILRDFHGYNSGAIEGLDKSIFLVDECHGLTGEQAGLFLKYVEEVPEWNYFVFCTTDPDKVLHTLRKRCVIQVEFDKVPETEIMKLLIEICEQEKIQPDEEVLRGIVERSAGLPRIAVNELQQSSLAGNLKKKRIQTLSGNNNTLVIAPHGHPKDDFNTGEIARRMHDKFGCYAVINEEYQKPESAGLDKPDVSNGTADLYDWNHINDFSELKEDFLHPVEDFKKKILAKHQSVNIIHIHGIGNQNMSRVASIIEKYKNEPDNLHVLVGYGQRAYDNSRHTAELENFVRPFIKEIKGDDLRIEIAPTKAIVGVDGKEKLYCGNDPDRLNQRLCEPKEKVQSIQLEIKKSGFRKNEEQAIKTADRLGEALSKIVRTELNPDHENKKVSTDNITPTEDHAYKIETRKISSLKSHPLNQQIYGDSDPDDNLKTSIQQSGILTPLLISDDDRILSGHRRYACAKGSGIKDVPVIVSPLENELDIEEALINANIQRQKTKEQIAREYMKLKEIESEKAKQRQAEAGGDRKSDESTRSLTQNSAEAISKGESRMKASSKLGISHDTGEKAAKVVLMADDLKKAGKMDEAQNLLDTLNKKSVNKAHKEAKAIDGNIAIPKEKGKLTFNKTTDSVEWATWTWNPVTGCNHGCKYCYAREMTNRFEDNFPNGFEPTFYPERLDAPGNTKFPVSKHIGDRNVFVVSMGDLFGDWVDQKWIDAVLETVRKYPQWNYLFLTKNPKRLDDIEWPDNAWVGTTVDNQARVKPAEEAFEKIKAKVKFLSCEPLPEELTFTNLKVFDWVIIGARSKTSQAPAMQPKREWVQSLMRQAWDAGCEVYCKPNLKSGVKEYPLAGVALKNINKAESEDNPEPNFNAPVIISASRRTDIPAFHSDWFMERLRNGYLVKRFSRNPKKTEHISFSNARLIVFWTKNPEPMFKYLDGIDQMGIGYYFQYTLNDYEGDNLEPNVPPLRERIDCFKKMSKRIGKERVIWRFDPLILTDVITRKKLLEKVHGIMTQLSGFTEKLVVSFMKADNHKKVVRNLNKGSIKYQDFSKDDIDYLASYLAKMGKEFGIEVAACAEEFDFSSHGIAPNKCIDDGLIRRVFSQDDSLMEFIGNGKGLKDPGQRPLCRCIVSKDIGEYHTCKHLCRYCYANISEKIVNRNVKMITQTGEMLLPKTVKVITDDGLEKEATAPVIISESRVKKYNRNRHYELLSAFQKSIRWCEVNESRYFARELMDMGLPGSVFNRLILIAAEDVGLADPSLIVYERGCLDRFDNLIKQYKMKKRDAVKFPQLCNIVDRAVIAAAISYKSRLLPQLCFATLFDIYENEAFSKNLSEYLDRFVVALKKRDEKQATYYAYVVSIFLNSEDKILKIVQKHSGMRNKDLIQKWVEEYKRNDERLMLAGSIVLLCRDLKYPHGEYNDAVHQYLSVPIKAADIPDRAYDMHTSAGARRGRSFEHFFDEAATVKNERFSNDWEQAGRNAYISANKEGLGKATKIIKAIKRNHEDIKNHKKMKGFIVQLPFDYKKAVLTQARTRGYRPNAFIVEFNDGSRKFMKGPSESSDYAQGHVICNEVKKKLASKYLHPIQCEIKEYGAHSVFLVCEELGKADLDKTTDKWTKLDGDIIVLDYDSNDFVPDPFKFLTGINNKDRDVWIAVMVNYCFRWVFGIGDTARRNLMLQRSTGKIYSTDETGIENVSHEKIWGVKKPNKKVFKLIKEFIESKHLNEVLTEVNRWKKSLDFIRREVVPLSKEVEGRIDKLLNDPIIVFDI